MRALFADTSFYVAIANPRDELHTRADALAREWRGRVITTDFVLVELANWLSRSGDRYLFVELLRHLRADARTTIVPADRRLMNEGCAIYTERRDKNWSLTDCISFVVMNEHGLTEALTADHHFEQAGFTVLLK